MGGYAGSIGNYALHMGDYVFDYVKRSQPQEYYKEYLIDMEFIKYREGVIKHRFCVERNKDVWKIKIPLLKLGKINKLKKYYEFIPDFNLQKLMWEEIKSRGFIVEGYICIGDWINGYGEREDIWNYYYLISNIGEEPIVLSSKIDGVDLLHEVHDYEEDTWIQQHSLNLITKLR